jgi:hypothetical protein
MELQKVMAERNAGIPENRRSNFASASMSTT